MPRVRARRYCGTLYFPTLEKRELWSEYMKDLKSRQVNDSTMNFFSAVKFFQCQPKICPDTERIHIQWYAELEKPAGLVEIQDLVEGTSDFCTHFCTDARRPSSSLLRYDVLPYP